jgi:SAM-dependent methyltransferase
MRDYTNFDKYLDRIEKDIYPQPTDKRHTQWAIESVHQFMSQIGKDVVESVLDLGCGEGFCQSTFESYDLEYTGVCLQRDFHVAHERGRNVFSIDFTFMPFENESYDLLYSRHSLEHSPFPPITLMEWHRVCRKFLAVVLPAPDYWGRTGRNHYFVLQKEQWESLFTLAGFNVINFHEKRDIMPPEEEPQLIEYWFLLEKK